VVLALSGATEDKPRRVPISGSGRVTPARARQRGIHMTLLTNGRV
jgi:hypothetical protein